MATVASSTNPNIEKIGSIKIFSSSSPNAAERSGLIFGGYAYSADVQANNGDGYSITIKVISKNGNYNINSSSLNANKSGSKNIHIGNFVFYDFFLISYSIDKEVENSILTLTYKDKSIFMDKLFIGLFNYHYGITLDGSRNELAPTGILRSEPNTVKFNYKCSEDNSNIRDVDLTRYLNRVQTARSANILLQRHGVLPDFLSSDCFFADKYNYKTDSVNGGFIILGREEINEENCALPDVTYCFKDLASALAYAEIPGIIDFNLGNNQSIYTLLRRKYFGTLRNVLDQWGNDLGFKFYYQPKIHYFSKDYTDKNSEPVEQTVREGIKLIDLASTSQTLVNLNTTLKENPNLSNVIESTLETATLEGTKKTSVTTSIRREARSFNSSSSYLSAGYAKVLKPSFLSSFYGNDPASLDTIIGGTLSIYDPGLRDIYHLTNGNTKALGISNVSSLLNSFAIVSKLDFLLLFGPSMGDVSPSALLDNYVALLCIYDEEKHNLIKEWEKNIMSSYYGKYYILPYLNQDNSNNNGFSSYSVEFTTSPPSQSYIANELPFADLLFGTFGSSKEGRDSGLVPSDYGTKKYNPIFEVDNPFDYRNAENYKTFTEKIPNYNSSKDFTVISLKNNSSAKMALLTCFAEAGVGNIMGFLEQNNASLIVCRKYGASFGSTSAIGNISISSGATNLSVRNLSNRIQNNTVVDTNLKTVCEQTLSELICGDPNQQTQINASDTGFLLSSARKITITSNYSVNGSPLICDLILPVDSDYKYVETKDINSTITIPGLSYVLGTPPTWENENVLSFEVADNDVPEILTQSSLGQKGIIDQIITFDDKDRGKNTLVLSAYDYHDIVSENLNSSVLKPFEQKRLSLTSTYIPKQLISYIFDSAILNSITFSFNESGSNTVLDFSSRPKQPKQKDSLFLTQRFLKKL